MFEGSVLLVSFRSEVVLRKKVEKNNFKKYLKIYKKNHNVNLEKIYFSQI